MHAQRLNLAIRLAAAIALVWTVGGSQAVHAQALTNTSNAAAPYRDGTIKVGGRTIHYLDWGPEGKPAFILVQWFAEILGGEVVDEARLPGLYGFELKERVETPDAFVRLLADEAGLVLTRQQREATTLVVRKR